MIQVQKICTLGGLGAGHQQANKKIERQNKLSENYFLRFGVQNVLLAIRKNTF